MTGPFWPVRFLYITSRTATTSVRADPAKPVLGVSFDSVVSSHMRWTGIVSSMTRSIALICGDEVPRHHQERPLPPDDSHQSRYLMPSRKCSARQACDQLPAGNRNDLTAMGEDPPSPFASVFSQAREPVPHHLSADAPWIYDIDLPLRVDGIGNIQTDSREPVCFFFRPRPRLAPDPANFPPPADARYGIHKTLAGLSTHRARRTIDIPVGSSGPCAVKHGTVLQ